MLEFPGARYRKLDRIFGRDVTDIALLVFPAGQVRRAVPDSAGTVSRAFVSAGRARLELPAEHVTLETGDYVTFASDVRFRWVPLDGADAHVLVLVAFGNQSWRTGGADPMADTLRQAGARPARQRP